MGQGTFGQVKVFNHFTAPPGGITTGVPDALFTNLGGGVGLIGVNEGVLALTIDEPGGIIDITTDTGDNDNQALVAGAFKPADGGMEMECRFKITDSVASARAAVFIGFTETFAHDTPVMPAETATTTTTYNGTGGMVGFLFDSDATTINMRFVAGDAGVALATVAGDYATVAPGTVGGAIGLSVNLTGGASGNLLVADKWYIAKIEVGTDGIAKGYFCGLNDTDTLRLVGKNTTALGTTDNFHAIAMIENRSGANERLEVDYFYANGWVDWTA